MSRFVNLRLELDIHCHFLGLEFLDSLQSSNKEIYFSLSLRSPMSERTSTDLGW